MKKFFFVLLVVIFLALLAFVMFFLYAGYKSEKERIANTPPPSVTIERFTDSEWEEKLVAKVETLPCYSNLHTCPDKEYVDRLESLVGKKVIQSEYYKVKVYDKNTWLNGDWEYFDFAAKFYDGSGNQIQGGKNVVENENICRGKITGDYWLVVQDIPGKDQIKRSVALGPNLQVYCQVEEVIMWLY